MRYIYDGNDGRELLRELIFIKYRGASRHKNNGQSLEVMEKLCCLDDIMGARRGVIENILKGTRNG